jgi:adenosine/AMP kinase
MKIDEVEIRVPEGNQIIIGQAHFIKTVEDLYETLTTSMPGLKFGVAFCEASGKALIRFDGSDPAATALAREYATRIGAGHSFVIVLGSAFPINIVNRVKAVEEVLQIFCATSNPVTLIVADNGKGRGILGVIDGATSKESESDVEKAERQAFLRKIGYKR